MANTNGNGNGHSHEQGLRVHHLANLGGLIALAGLDLEPPDYLLGALLSVAQETRRLSPAEREQVARLGRTKLEQRETGKRAWKSWQRAQDLHGLTLSGAQVRDIIKALGHQPPHDPTPLVLALSEALTEVRGMKRIRFLRPPREIELKLRHEHAERPQKLVPWWARALRQLGVQHSLRRQQPRGSLSGDQPPRINVAEPAVYARRSVVKASFSRNRWSGGWAAHARYLSRPGAQQEFNKGLGFNAERVDIDLLNTVRGWERQDELLWRFIVSPEDADRLNLREHVRGLVDQMQQDLGTKLQWVAIDHHNTDDAHVHLLVRGVRENGRPLEINRDYLRSDLRVRSQELATKQLGPRLEPEMLRSRERAVRREQWTEIDRALQRKADQHGVVSYALFQPHSEGARIKAEQEIDRLQFLTGLGLARRVDDYSWQLDEKHERELREEQRAHDVIKSRAHDRQRGSARDRDWARERRGQNHG